MDERFIVEITDLSLDDLESQNGFITIEDTDDPPSMYIKSVEVVDLNGEEVIQIVLKLTAKSDYAITKDLKIFNNLTADGNAAGTVTVTFPPRILRQDFTITFEDAGGAP